MLTGTEPHVQRARRASATAACTKNRYYRRSRLSERKFREILRCFSIDLTATNTAILTGVSVRSINSIFLKVRSRIARYCEQTSVFNKQGAGRDCQNPANINPQPGLCNDRVPVLFGLTENNGRISTEMVTLCATPTLRDLVHGHANLTDLFSQQDWISRYDVLIDLDHQRYFRLQWPDSPCPRITSTAAGVEVFWGFAKHRLHQFRGIHRATINLHMIETEFRFNHRREALQSKLLGMLRDRPL